MLRVRLLYRYRRRDQAHSFEVTKNVHSHKHIRYCLFYPVLVKNFIGTLSVFARGAKAQ